MRPGQCMGKAIDYRTDFYAHGCCIIYECVTGYSPFGGGVYEILTSHVGTPLPKPAFHFDLAAEIAKLLCKKSLSSAMTGFWG